ncbi:glucokinase [Desulfatiglans anilini]|uniref:glucokinase n=1 Tax=Desulfatiglans anilini TaxID=90728 RepID=UPI00040BE995|nr:glucokinase [Desulfatiglans anilini]
MDGETSTGMMLAGDIGGTKTVLGLFRRGAARPVLQVSETWLSSAAQGVAEHVERFLERHPAEVQGAVLAMAGPVIDGVCKTTNLPWRVSEKELEARFGWRVRLINDLAAAGCFVPFLESGEVYALNEAKPRARDAIALIAPGTGLGNAFLTFVDGQYRPFASEGGHMDFAPADEEQLEVWRCLARRFGHVSVERVASGRGLLNLFASLREIGGYSIPDWLRDDMERKDPARAITDAAMEKGEPLCVKVLGTFCSVLGAAAGNLALAVLATGGVYLAGGIPPKILPALADGRFMKAFADKGRFSGLLQGIAVRVILNQKASLMGAAQRAFEMDAAAAPRAGGDPQLF